MKAVIILMVVGASQAQYLFGNNPLWNAGAVHQDPLWATRSAAVAPFWVPQDTAEVQAAKAAHFAAHAEAHARGKRSPQYLAGNNPLWNAGAVHHDPLWAVRGATPLGPQDTPEVAAAKAAHFAAHAEARARGKRSPSPQYLFGNNPLWNAGSVHQDPLWAVGGSHARHLVPQDTPEVQAAKAAHFAAHAEALARGK